MKKRRCSNCGNKVKLMTPPQVPFSNGLTGTFCSEICRKEYVREITPEQGKVIRRAALKTSPKEN